MYNIYNQDASADDRARSKAVNIYSQAEAIEGCGKILFRFQHLADIFVSADEQVERGQVIGLTGHTGFKKSIGDHLHFEIRLNPACLGFERDDSVFASIPVNPYFYLLDWWN